MTASHFSGGSEGADWDSNLSYFNRNVILV